MISGPVCHLGLVYLTLGLETLAGDDQQLVRLAGPASSQIVTVTILPYIFY